MPQIHPHNPNARIYKQYSESDVENALKDISECASLRAISIKYKISVGTLSNKSNGKHALKVGRPNALFSKEEDATVAHIITCAEWGFPMDKHEQAMIVRSYLDLAKRKVAAFKNNVPGKGFALGFLNRHKEKLQMRLVSNYSRQRASLSAAVINEYFNNLELTLRDVPPENIFNYDETNLTDNPGKRKCIIKRGAKYPQRILNETKSAISLMLCGNAVGELLPPYIC